MKFCKKCQCETERFASGHCKTCTKARDQAWLKANPEKASATRAAYHAANRGSATKSRAAYRAAHPERVKTSGAVYRAANLKKSRIHNQNQRARKRSNGGKLSKGLAAKLYALQKGMCPCCVQPLGDDFHLDHIVPIARGGPNTDSNIQLLRQKCNLQKRDKHPVEFMQERGFLL